MPYVDKSRPIPAPAKSIAQIVASVACAACGAPIGLPCLNKLYGFRSEESSRKLKRRQRSHYQNYVHLQRRNDASKAKDGSSKESSK